MTSRHSRTGAFDSPYSLRTASPIVRWKKYGVAMIAIWIIAAFASAQNHISEYEVKGAYLFNFGKFVRSTVPEADLKRQSFDICIVGEDPFGHSLDAFTANEQIDGKPVRITRLKNIADARTCTIAYISASERPRVKNDLDELRGQPVLTVSDAENFLQNGGMIQFVIQAKHVRFAVNLDAVKKAELSLSSELLKVAISVNGKPPTEVEP